MHVQLAFRRLDGTGAPEIALVGSSFLASFGWNSDEPHVYEIARDSSGNYRIKVTNGATGQVAIDQSVSRGSLPISPGMPLFAFGTAAAGAGNSTFVSFEAQVVGTALQVAIDIKPGSDPNSVSLSDQGLLPVAILGSAGFDVGLIDPATLGQGGVDLATRGSARAPKLAYSFEDVNADGFWDAVAFFSVPELVAVGALTERRPPSPSPAPSPTARRSRARTASASSRSQPSGSRPTPEAPGRSKEPARPWRDSGV